MRESPILGASGSFQSTTEPLSTLNPLYDMAEQLNQGNLGSNEIHVYKVQEGQVIIQQGSPNTHPFLHPLSWTENGNSHQIPLHASNHCSPSTADNGNGQIQHPSPHSTSNGSNLDFRREESHQYSTREKGKGRAFTSSNTSRTSAANNSLYLDNEIPNPLPDDSTPPATPPKDRSPPLEPHSFVNDHDPAPPLKTTTNSFPDLPIPSDSLSKPLPPVVFSNGTPLTVSTSSTATITGLVQPMLKSSSGSGTRRASTSGIANGMIRMSPRISSLPRATSYQHEGGELGNPDMGRLVGQRNELVFDEVELSILAQAESIRKERLVKKLELEKLESEKEKESRSLAMPKIRRRSTRAGSTGEPTLGAGVLMGNLIGQDHANYVLMYNMLTGIRIAVSR